MTRTKVANWFKHSRMQTPDENPIARILVKRHSTAPSLLISSIYDDNYVIQIAESHFS